MNHIVKETVLVTGGSGFVSTYCIMQLLKEGYAVKTTLRSLDKSVALKKRLESANLENLENLSFLEADLNSDEGWNEAATGCGYVLHVASPFPALEQFDEEDLIETAREGALRVLRAARRAKTKRVVLTSSFAAIGYSADPGEHVFSESDWTNPNMKLPAYIRSKTIAELAAWEYIEKHNDAIELAVINPVGVFGPVLGQDLSSSIVLIQQLLAGKGDEMPQVSFGVVDVRDVADIHIRAMLHPGAKGQRFIATADGSTTFAEINEVLRTDKNLPNGKLPDLSQVSLQPELIKKISNLKAKSVLSWNPRPKEETIIDTAESLFKFNLVH